MARRRAQPNATNVTQKQPTQMRVTRKRGNEETDSAACEEQEVAVPKPSKRSKGDDEVIQQFRDQVKKDQNELEQLFQQRSEEAEQEDKHRRDGFISMLGETLHAPHQSLSNDAVPTNPRNVYFAANSLHMSLSTISESCQSLLFKYNSLENLITQMANELDTSVTEAWATDVAETEKLLGLGHKQAVRGMKRALGMGAGGTGEEIPRIEGFQKEEKHGFELQKSLRCAERGVRRMVKGLPRSETDDVD
ncbi:hypothetical protein DM02DRAFT_676276 [Periconia macrospinosa]|uniref:Uncharacterized protein n=1 Tax=Periconia macrospinosa TaxID=97972 RepID=A0A2V1DAU2_9PLEO|nr:hypothetical protein DM02DRAFT_676276 [Periconia macrospinosa]